MESRRKALTGLLAIIVTSVITPANASMRGPAVQTAARLLADAFSEFASVAAIGEAYLSRFPAENDASVLARLVLGTDLDEHLQAQYSLTELGNLIERARQQDFDVGETLEVSGWVLSLTEARLCAFVTLFKRASGNSALSHWLARP